MRNQKTTKPTSIKKKFDPHHIDNDKCTENIGNIFNMVLIAAARAKELSRGHAKKIPQTNGITITALREIEAGQIGPEYLRKI